MAASSEASTAYASGAALESPSAASSQLASSMAASVQVASVQVASVQVASVQVASVQVASVHVASDQVASSQVALLLTLSSQLAQSKTGAEPPFGSEVRNWSRAAFGFGGFESAAAFPAFTSPAPIEFGAAFGAFF